MRKSPARDYDREKAITLICKSIINVDRDVIKRMLCLSVGHPAAVRVDEYNGEAKCARCGVYMPITLGGWTALEGNIKTMGKLTPTDLLLTGIPVVAKVPV